MSEKPGREENPLEDAAAEMSEGMRGTSIEVEQTSKSRVEGGQVRMVESAAKSVSASALHMQDSAAAVVRAGTVDVTDGVVGVAVASDVKLADSTSLLAVGNNVQADDVRALMVLAARINGRVESVFTPLTALAAGAGLAFGLVLFSRTFAWLAAQPVRKLRRRRGDGLTVSQNPNQGHFQE